MGSNALQVVDGVAEFGIGHLLMVYVRYQSVAFSKPLYALELRLAQGRPLPLKGYLNLLKPFPGIIWTFWGISLVIIFVTAFLFGLVYNSNYEKATGSLLQFFGVCFTQSKTYTNV